MARKIAQTVSRLPGALDDIPVFHSNSPELVLEAGILLSTFPEGGKKFSHAHLNYAVEGKFALFFHHSTDSTKTTRPNTLYLGALLGNSSDRPVSVYKTGGASYATKPDAPFVVLDAVLNNDDKLHFAGPGDRVSLDLLTQLTEPEHSQPVMLEPGETKLFQSFPLPKGFILTPLNGRTGLFQFDCDGPVNLAVVSAFAEPGFLSEKPPAVGQFLQVLKDGDLVAPRDKTPTVPGASGELIYGRVAGVAKGASWNGTIASDSQSEFSIRAGQTFSFPLCTVIGGTLGSEQVQSAPMLCRYQDTAYQSHGNYGVTYNLNLPIRNADAMPINIEFTFQSPLKNSNQADSLNFLTQSQRTVFRGTVKFSWTDSLSGRSQTKLIHLVQTQGMVGTALLELNVEPGDLQIVDFSFIYPADCTPPHVLTIRPQKTN